MLSILTDNTLNFPKNGLKSNFNFENYIQFSRLKITKGYLKSTIQNNNI